jgi:hypothetical protein
MRIGLEQGDELALREGGGHARTAPSRAVGQGRRPPHIEIALDPAVDRAARDARSSRNLGEGLAFGHGGDRLQASIEPDIVHFSERLQQAPLLNTAEARASRSVCVHLDTIGSLGGTLQDFWLPT